MSTRETWLDRLCDRRAVADAGDGAFLHRAALWLARCLMVAGLGFTMIGFAPVDAEAQGNRGLMRR